MAVVASAPGKVLITGGYLILETPNAGLVLSTNARFYTIVKPLYEEIKPESWVWSWTDVKLTSPQLSREATYKLSLKHSTLQCTSSRDSTNPFVEQAVQYAAAAAKAMHIDKDKVDELYKLLLQEVSNGTLTGEKCKPEVAKTGLGSSAAMTTSVVAAVLHYLGVVNLPLSSVNLHVDNMVYSDLDLVHIIAQSAHCIAQGKIGSGFDVSAAVYGSQRYVRFSPAVLSSAQVVRGNQFPDVITVIMKEKWDHEKIQFALPPLMTLLLGEPGTGGSSTPSMVNAVKQWQKSDPQKSLETWNRLAEANLMLETHFRRLHEFAEKQWETYMRTITSCSGLTHGKWMEQAADPHQETVVKLLVGAREAFLRIRFHMQEMGKASGVPIEPESQTRLLDTTMNMEGVLLAGVPGAGGFDAIFAITLGEVNKKIMKTWSSLGVLPLLVREDPHGVSLESGDPRTQEMSSGISSIHIE